MENSSRIWCSKVFTNSVSTLIVNPWGQSTSRASWRQGALLQAQRVARSSCATGSDHTWIGPSGLRPALGAPGVRTRRVGVGSTQCHRRDGASVQRELGGPAATGAAAAASTGAARRAQDGQNLRVARGSVDGGSELAPSATAAPEGDTRGRLLRATLRASLVCGSHTSLTSYTRLVLWPRECEARTTNTTSPDYTSLVLQTLVYEPRIRASYVRRRARHAHAHAAHMDVASRVRTVPCAACRRVYVRARLGGGRAAARAAVNRPPQRHAHSARPEGAGPQGALADFMRYQVHAAIPAVAARA